jgi:DNA-binding response OmpR family regulator
MAENEKKALGRIALQKQPSVPEDAVATLEGLRALSERYGVPGLDLTQVAIPLEHLDLLPREIATRHAVLPVLVQDERIFLAMANPDDKRVIDELEFVTGKRVFPYVAPQVSLAKVIDAAYDLKSRNEAYYLGPSVPHEVLVRLGLVPTSPEPEPQIPPAPPPPRVMKAAQQSSAARPPGPPSPPARKNSDPGVPQSIIPPKMEAKEGSVADQFAEGDFAGGSELSSIASAPVAITSPIGNDPTAMGQNRLVLVVDDEEDIRRLLKRVLVDRGYRVVEADRGTAALRLVKEHVPDLIILDAMLPELHGFEICRRIKGSQKYGQIPIIMISAVYRGWRYAEDLKQNYGVDAYIEKPFRITEVLKAVEQVTSAKKSGDPSEKEKTSAEAESALNAGIGEYQKGNVDAAIAHLKRGSAIDPLAYRLHYHLGLLFGKKGQIYEAIQALETAVEINGKHFPALKNLAVLYQKAGFKLKAVEMWERALNHAPDEPTRSGIKEHLLTLL